MIALKADTGVSRETDPAALGAMAASFAIIAIEDIDVATNVRAELGDLDDLAASIAELGILEPITVTRADDRYTVKTGHRRLAAARQAGLLEVPALIDERVELREHGARRSTEQLVENLQRADLNPVDEARALREILDDEKGLKQAELAKRIGRSPSWIANTLGLLKTAPEIQAHVAAGELSAAHVRAVSGLPPAEQVRILENAIEFGESAHDLEEEAQGIRSRAADLAKRAKESRDVAVTAVAALTEAAVSTDVVVNLAARYDLDREVIAKAIEAAGWQTSLGYAEPAHEHCDCRTMRLHIGDPKGKWTVARVCTNDAHRQARFEVADRERQEKAAAARRESDALAAAAAARMLEVPLDRTVARLLLRQMENYNGHTWTEYSAMPDVDVARAIASRLFWPGGMSKPIPTDKVLEALGGTSPAPVAPEEPKGKRKRPQASLDEAIAEGDAPAPVKGLPAPRVAIVDSVLDDTPETVEAGRKAGVR